jgi:hypothetical protein
MKILATDTHAQNVYKTNIKRLDALGQTLLIYCSSLTEITDKDAFFKAPISYVVNQFRVKSNLALSDEKIISLYELPINEINKLQNAYFTQKRSIPDGEPDFNIYAKDKAHEQTFKKLEILCQMLNELNAFSDTNAIHRATHNAIKLDNGRWTPNPHFEQTF